MSFIPDIKKRIGIAVAGFILMSGTTYTVKAHPSIKKLPGLETNYGYNSHEKNSKVTSKDNEEKIENKDTFLNKITDSELDDKTNKEKEKNIQNIENKKEDNKTKDETLQSEKNNKQEDNKPVIKPVEDTKPVDKPVENNKPVEDNKKEDTNMKSEKDGLYEVKIKTLKENEDADSMAGEYIKKVNYEVKNGKKYLMLSLDSIDWMKDISITVDGQEINPTSTDVVEKEIKDGLGNKKGKIRVEVGSLDSKIIMHMNVEPMGNARVGFRILPQKETLKLVNEGIKPTEDTKLVVKPIEDNKPTEKPVENNKPVEDNKKEDTNTKSEKDGLYEVKIKTLKENEDADSMAGAYIKKVNYEVKNEKKYLMLSLDSIDWMKDISITVDGQEINPTPTDVVEKENKDGLGNKKGKIRVEVGSLDSKIMMHMNVEPMGNARVAFRILLQKETLKLVNEGTKPTEDTKPVVKPVENKIADGVYTVGFVAYKLEDPTDTSMLTNFFDNKVKLEVKNGKLNLTFLNTCFANGLYDFRIGSNDAYPESIAKGYGKVDREGVHEYQTFEILISDLESEHIGGVLVGPMGALKTDFGNMDKYRKVNIVFNKELIKGWNGFDADKQVVNEDKKFNKALIMAELDKDGNGIVSDDELAMAEGEIELSRRGLKDISRLKNLGNKVTDLYLVGNEISELPEGVFDNLTNLKKLYISGNQIEKLPKGIFDKLTQLTELQLGKNNIKELPKGIFDKLINLESLSLYSNAFNEIDPNTFDKLEKLNYLSLENTKLQTIPEGIFSLPNLSWLVVSNNKITKIPKELSKLEKLTWLDLSSNYIEELPIEMYEKLKSLKNLYINDNLIKEIPENILELLPNISDCSIEFNKLNNIPKSIDKKMILRCPQKTPMELGLIAEDGKITWKQDLSGVDIITWKKTTNPYSKVKVPENIDEYKKHLAGKAPIELLHEKGYEPKIITLIQKKDNKGKYITLKEIIAENESDIMDNYTDPHMKSGDEYRILKKGYVTFYASEDYVFTDVAYATAKKVDSVPEINQKQFKIKVLKENSDEESMAKEYLNEDVVYKEKDGKKFFTLTLDKINWMKNINVNVDGKDVKYDKNQLGSKAELSFEVGSEDSKVKLSMNVEPMGNAKVAFRIVKSTKPSTSGTSSSSSSSSSGSSSTSTTHKKGDMSQDGLYRLEIKVLKEKDDSDSMAGEYLGGRANVEVRGKNKYLILTFTKSEWMSNIDVTVDGSSEKYDVVEETTDSNGHKTKTIKFKISDIDSKIMVNMNVEPMGNARVAFRVIPQKNTATYDGKKYKSNGSSSSGGSTSSSTKAKTNTNKTNVAMNKDGLYEINTEFTNEYYDEQQVIKKYLDNKAYIQVKGNKKYIIVPIKVGKDKWNKDIKNINIIVDGNKTNYEVVDEKTNSIKFEIPKVDSKIAINMKSEPMKDTEIKFNVILDKTTTKLIEEYNNTSNTKKDSTKDKNNTNKDISNINNTSSNNKKNSNNKKKSETNKQIKNVSSDDETSKVEDNKLPQTGMPIGMGGMSAIGALLATLGFTLRKKDNEK